MNVPDHLAPLLKELAARHWADQILQIRRMGIDHPQGMKAREELTRARELAQVMGVNTGIAA